MSETFTAYLAAPGFEAELRAELGEVSAEYDRLLLSPGPARPAAWAQNIWHDARIIEVASIGEAAKALRAIQRNWRPYEFHLHRRTALLVDKLPKVSAKPLTFGAPAPTAPLGSFTWLDEGRVLAAAHCSSPFPNGEMSFVEDREGPPSRAYLKLWEAFTLVGAMPRPGELCVDLGACPGGWTWVLAETGARVIAIDKAPLDPRVAARPNVEFRQGSAFGPEADSIAPVDWLCSDVICYPERLLRLVERRLEAGTARNFVCTLKFQGETDHATARAFAAIPNSRLLHLSCNKHELTWIRLAPADE